MFRISYYFTKDDYKGKMYSEENAEATIVCLTKEQAENNLRLLYKAFGRNIFTNIKADNEEDKYSSVCGWNRHLSYGTEGEKINV